MMTIDICSLPRIRFAHIYQAEQYQNRIGTYEGFVEITYLAEGEFTVKKQQEIYRVKKGDVTCLLHEEPVTIEAEGPHCHHTVGINVQWCATEDSEAGLRLPFLTPAELGTEEIRQAIDEIIYEKEHYGASNSRFTAKVLGILDKIDRCARETLPDQISGEKLYAQRAKKFIQQNMFAAITQGDVAEHLGISPGYLCSVFKKAEGITVMKYINKLKLESMRSLMEKEHIYLYEAAAIYGYADPNYVSKLFKQLFGYNITDNHG